MGITWRDFQFPKRVSAEQETYTPTFGRFVAEPLERGYGVTLGNIFRRVLLSSIEGTAVTSIKIDGVSHEFSTIEGVQEDVTEIIMNIKNLVLRSYSKSPKTVTIKESGQKEVRARDIITDESVEIINPDLLIATLTSKSSKLNIEM